MRLSRWLAGLVLMTALAGCAQVSAAATAGNPVLAGSTPEPEAMPAEIEAEMASEAEARA